MRLEQASFEQIKKLLLDECGLNLDKNKFNLVRNRLYERMSFYKIRDFSKYIKILEQSNNEKKIMINRLTTNETYFFREKKHFDFLKEITFKYKNNEPFRVWSAASSIGSEAYSIAMILNEQISAKNWEVLGTDINNEVIKIAKVGLYDEGLIEKIPLNFRQKYCLKGKGKYKGKFLIDKKVLSKVKFLTHNLLDVNLNFGKFNVIFIRNVLIYFDKKTQIKVIKNLLKNLKKDGFLITSLTEHISSLNIKELKKINSSIYQYGK